MKVQFTQYLHDEWEEGLDWDLLQKINALRLEQGLPALTQDENYELADRAGRPFYEIGVPCEFDTETGQVTMLVEGLV